MCLSSNVVAIGMCDVWCGVCGEGHVVCDAWYVRWYRFESNVVSMHIYFFEIPHNKLHMTNVSSRITHHIRHLKRRLTPDNLFIIVHWVNGVVFRNSPLAFLSTSWSRVCRLWEHASREWPRAQQHEFAPSHEHERTETSSQRKRSVGFTSNNDII